jgi:hypothetical protein
VQSRSVDLYGLAAKGTSLELCPPKTRSYPLNYQISFQFGDGRHYHYDCPTQWSTRVKILPKRDELDTQMIQSVEHFQKVSNATRKTVCCPHHQYIELPSVSSSEHFVKLRTFVFSATHFVRVLMDDVVATLSSQLAQIK